MSEHETNTENVRTPRRRATDTIEPKKSVPPPSHGFRGSLFTGVFSLGIATAIFTSGMQWNNYTTKVDSNVESIKVLLKQNQELIIAIKEQNIQQKESDKRFEQKFDDANDQLKDIIDGQKEMNNNIMNNSKDIIILQQKISLMAIDGVTVAMR